MASEEKKTREVRAGDVVGYRYLIRDDSGHVLATSTELVRYVHGGQNALPAAVRMKGRVRGETFMTPLSEEQAFGSAGRMEPLTLPRERFPTLSELPAGQQVGVVLPDGDAVAVWVDEAETKKVSLEVDHPFAEHGLRFEISVVSIRLATKSELESGVPFQPTSPGDGSPDVAGELATLREALEQRFDDESSAGGLIHALRQDATSNDRRVDALRDAHATLLAELDTIAARVGFEGADYDHKPALAALVHELALHDEKGTNLLRNSVNQDTGGEG